MSKSNITIRVIASIRVAMLEVLKLRYSRLPQVSGARAFVAGLASQP